MNRKQFIESQGATCDNWTWSWSFINEKEKIIIFGAWDLYSKGTLSLILSEDWKENRNGRKQPGYEQSREHIRLIEEESYQLKTFPIKHSPVHEKNDGPSKIESFEEKLTNRILKKIGNGWHASDGETSNLLPEEVSTPELYVEGTSNTITVNTYERNFDARARCIEFYGYKCNVCNFDFKQTYGSVGEEYIHVHHIIPLSEIKKEYDVDPIKDLVPVCPNCHAIIHRTTPALTVEQLKNILENK
jgi:5-methylcytosine-specific restriction protein A